MPSHQFYTLASGDYSMRRPHPGRQPSLVFSYLHPAAGRLNRVARRLPAHPPLPAECRCSSVRGATCCCHSCACCRLRVAHRPAYSRALLPISSAPACPCSRRSLTEPRSSRGAPRPPPPPVSSVHPDRCNRAAFLPLHALKLGVRATSSGAENVLRSGA